MHPVTLRVTIARDLNLVLTDETRSVPGGIPTQSVETIRRDRVKRLSAKIVPTLRVGMHPVTLRVTTARDSTSH
ncbi:hypothetical protein AWV77_27015 [Pseudomonas palleroniana]|uniref:Uncharacterized protein n=1 Tax=Pseudomonas palleroniana TaxID=191390 RepID=A0A109FNN9_9PSED|nr:hypothetical protein AWV77_27015 [Pseudomonas palleroniana]